MSGGSSEELTIDSPLLGAVLEKGKNYTFKYSGEDENETTYLEVNGRIQWAGTLNLTNTLNDGEDVSDDGMKFSIADGTGRDAIIFELDDDGVPSVGGSVALYRGTR